ncbi:MAG TPA: efflux RND transporter periplasmic adaptor subunit [Woeseiaceae bacterium]|nr:efflux RND transporter periplasmic adaptor subunit [Woeseiaceae bacterium]
MIGESALKIADTSSQDVKLAPRSKLKPRLVLAAVILALLTGAWLATPALERWANATETVPMDRVRIATVSRGDLVRDVSVQGRVVAAVRPTLYASASGTITLSVEAGQQVTEGQVLATVDSPELTSQLQQLQSAYEQKRMDLQRERIELKQLALDKHKAADLAKVALTAANREKRRADEGYKLGVVPSIDHEKANDELEKAELAHQHATADASLFDERAAFESRATEFELQQQQLALGELQRQVDLLTIRSPVNGIVGDLLVQQKAAVARDTPVMAVVDLTRFEIDVQIPESYADDLAIGMQAEISQGATRYAGTLVAVSPQIANNQVSGRVRFVDAAPSNLRQNQRLTTRILLDEHPDVLMVQRGQFLDTGGGRIAYVVGDDGMAVRRPIEIGARSLAAVEITGGLEAGDRIIVSSLAPFNSAETVLLTQ